MKFLATIALLLAAPIILLVSAQKTGQLYVRLNKATNLRDKDWFGKSDPFVEMWLDDHYKSRSKDTKGLNPVFNETFCFWVLNGQNTLHVRAVDKDTFSNDKIGDVKIPLAPVFQSGAVPAKDYVLPKWFGLRSNGVVNLEMKFVPGV
ncbi:hypothetical protein DFQ27_006112 [Actinomortierella ambigua]|uniref:C2 domain-containing protein n=1 Tax=Actinomortierella ambigua TaxID=1343610 RepID=A0A9P6U1Z1_9FUNG|nr:hypothetical protein DFQ26_003768 [Actinomortierella ambigua]KAG0255714.1 hypothetical protein DFQ27_006112 [Actinomortierella ambigua]